MVTIKVKTGIFTKEYTPEQLKKELEDFEFLKEALLYLINPEFLKENWDTHIDEEEAINGSKEIYLESGWDKEFIDKVYERHDRKQPTDS